MREVNLFTVESAFSRILNSRVESFDLDLCPPLVGYKNCKTIYMYMVKVTILEIKRT